MELHCDEHEKADQVYLVGEQCLQNYLKQNNGKCPIEQHDNCEFSQVKTARKFASELLVICPRQFDLKREQLNEGTKLGGEEGESCDESNSKNNYNCNFKGKMKDLKDHLDNSCKLIPTKQSIPYESTNQFDVMSKQIKELQNFCHTFFLSSCLNKSQTKNIIKLKKKENVKNLKADSLKKDEQIFELIKDIQQFKTEMNQTIVDLKRQQNEQIDNFKRELQEKDETITTLKIDNIEFKKQMEQYQIKYNEYKQNIETKVENQPQIEEDKKMNKKSKSKKMNKKNKKNT
ncbi:hypothetical protein RFI_06453 [Reticulomyxa filosa]|uniref:TRAF-type domain-containing protein n=1 Tax=Reticulomyxa filosa TaxID=46433 RepID=X6NZF4_RETFI|nr:hypothetical protein RFI_06453 [Reticulomyxa filosa]|eukprot:ETO30667.1 hypothetical protein RFI_06453 [Reticulomyxa filosa]